MYSLSLLSSTPLSCTPGETSAKDKAEVLIDEALRGGGSTKFAGAGEVTELAVA